MAGAIRIVKDDLSKTGGHHLLIYSKDGTFTDTADMIVMSGNGYPPMGGRRKNLYWMQRGRGGLLPAD